MEHSLLLRVEALINLEFCVASQRGKGVSEGPSFTRGWLRSPSTGYQWEGLRLPSNPVLEANGQRVTLRPKGFQRRNAHEMSTRFPHLASQMCGSWWRYLSCSQTSAPHLCTGPRIQTEAVAKGLVLSFPHWPMDSIFPSVFHSLVYVYSSLCPFVC